MASSEPETPSGSADSKPEAAATPHLLHGGDASEASDVAHTTKEPPAPEEGNKATKLILLISVFISMFLVALDRTIISTAIPAISNDFNSLGDVGWYGSAYLLTCCAFQLLFGKVYTVFSVRAVLLASIFLFEVGSAVCGAAPSSVAFIVGRAVCGVGAAGLFAGTIVCIIYIVPLHQRPKVQGMFGAVFGIASIVGPLIGGAFTSNVTWRWCFYINLPIGGVAMVVIAMFLKVPDRETTKLPLGKKILQLDLLGTSLLIPGVVCLLLALQWGGPTYPWNNGRIIALLTLAGVLLIAYAVVQATLPLTATIPPRLFKNRNVISALWATVCINAGNYIFIYFLPIWFQAIKGVSPVDSGIRLLPVMLAMVVGSILGGFLNTKLGYYTPLAIVGSCIAAVGAGLLTTLQVNTPPAKWIGYQILYGIGLGTSFQAPNLAVQTALPRDDVPMGIAFMFFGGLVGSTIFVSVGENVLSNQLVARLAGLPGFDAAVVTSGGVTALLDTLPPGVRDAAVIAYNVALREVFRVGLIVACLAVLGTATLEWLSVKKPPAPGGKPGEAGVGVEEKSVGEDIKKAE